MQNSTFSKLFFGLMIILLQTACVKEGPIGPSGAAGTNGATGAQGVQGVAGSNGTPGKDGNANVQGQVFNVKASDWQKVFYTGSTIYYYYAVGFNVPAVTQSVVDKGIVMCYRSGATTTSWAAIPYSYSFASGSTVKVINYDAVHSLGKVFISLSATDDLPGVPTSEQNYKVVVITPQGREANPDLNWKNYAEVAKAFDLD